MFKGNQKREPMDAAADTIIGNGAVIEGQVQVEGCLRVDGRLVGSLTVNGLLVVGSAAEIRADVEASEARVAGTIRGNLRARESVELLQGARLEGDVFTKCFRIEDGAFFQGNCHMGEAWIEEVRTGNNATA